MRPPGSSVCEHSRPYQYGCKRRIKYHLQQRYKIVTETITWKYSARRKRILAYERECALALANLAQVRPDCRGELRGMDA